MKEAADDMATQAEIVDLLTFMCRSAFASPKWEAICGLDDGMNSAHVQARALYGPYPPGATAHSTICCPKTMSRGRDSKSASKILVKEFFTHWSQ